MSLTRSITRALTQPFTSPLTSPGVGGGFNPASLFAAGEQGAWYDPSDFTTMFQDAAGITPVTAVEQPVGLILDKSGRGNHASQATSASRPVLSARKNLLTATEDFSNAEWAAYIGLTKTADTLTFVNANSYVQYDSGTLGGAVTGTQVTFSLTLSTPTPQTFRVVIIDGSDGVPEHALTINTTSTPARFVHSTTIGASFSGNMTVQIHGNNTITPGTVVTVAEPQLEISPAATRYQRVNTATSYDEVGFPMFEFFDGVDDNQTAAAGGGASTAFTLLMGVRPTSIGTAKTLWSDCSGNTGLKLGITAGGNIEFSGGNGAAIVAATGAVMTGGTDYVVTATYDGTSLSVQLNNGAATTAACALVAGTASFTIGKDNGAASGNFAGRIYETIHVKDVLLTAPQIAEGKTFIADKMQVTL